jgi:hypothetical protein
VQLIHCDVCLETFEEALKAERRKMPISKSIVSVLILLAFSIIIGQSVNAQQPYRITDRQVGVILQRLDRSSIRFRNSLNVTLVQVSVDQTQPQNDINTFQPGFERATKQFRDQFTRRLAVASDVENILQQATLINGFMTSNPLNARVQKDWTLVRTDLNSLANSYGVIWQWNPPIQMKLTSNRSPRLSDNELNQLIQQIEIGGDRFRSSLTDAFDGTGYDRSRSEGGMNDALRGLKNETDKLRTQFDARKPIGDNVQRVLARTTPIDAFMRENRLTEQVQTDWSTLRGYLNTLARAYNLIYSE